MCISNIKRQLSCPCKLPSNQFSRSSIPVFIEMLSSLFATLVDILPSLPSPFQMDMAAFRWKKFRTTRAVISKGAAERGVWGRGRRNIFLATKLWQLLGVKLRSARRIFGVGCTRNAPWCSRTKINRNFFINIYLLI